MERGIVELGQVQFLADCFHCLIDGAWFELKLLGNDLVNADRWYRQIGKVGCFDLCQLFLAAFVGLCLPPAWDILPCTQILDDFLDGLLWYINLMRDLCANAVKLGGLGQFQVTLLNLFDLLWCWHKGCWWRRLFALRSW